MTRERVHQFLDPDSRERAARWFRGTHHAMLSIGIADMLAETVEGWRQAYGLLFGVVFALACLFFAAEYGLRLYSAAERPGAEHRGEWGSRLAWAVSPGGLCDLAGCLPLVLLVVFGSAYASLFAFFWVFKIVRYAPGLISLQRVIVHARQALLSVLLGFGVVLLAAASLAYLFEHNAQPRAFASIPAALWWAVVTLTTTGYGDVVPQTLPGRLLGGVVMISGILVFALWAGILATGYAEEIRRRQFLRTWDLVAKVPFFHDVGAGAIAEVTRLLRARDYPAGAVIMRRGEIGDCMYFIVEGEVEVQVLPAPRRLGPGDFFGELALLTGGQRTATIIAASACTLLSLDIVDFRELLARQPELARVIHAEASARLEASATADLAVALDGSA